MVEIERDPRHYSSLESLVEQIAHSCIRSERNADIALMRLGLNQMHTPTLQQIGDNYLISRERVRQIVKRKIPVLKRYLLTVEDLWASIERAVRDSGEFVSVSSLSAKLASEYGWQDPPGDALLANVCALNTAFVAREKRVYLTAY